MSTISDNSVFLNLGNSASSRPSFESATTANLQQEANTSPVTTSQLLSNVGLGQISNTLDLLSNNADDTLTYDLVSLQNSSSTSLAASEVSDEISGAVESLINVTA